MNEPEPVDTRNLQYVDEPVPELPPPGSEVMIARSARIPIELDQWLRDTAERKGIRPSELARELMELGRTMYEADDHPVSLAEAMAALAALRSRAA